MAADDGIDIPVLEVHLRSEEFAQSRESGDAGPCAADPTLPRCRDAAAAPSTDDHRPTKTSLARLGPRSGPIGLKVPERQAFPMREQAKTTSAERPRSCAEMLCFRCASKRKRLQVRGPEAARKCCATLCERVSTLTALSAGKALPATKLPS